MSPNPSSNTTESNRAGGCNSGNATVSQTPLEKMASEGTTKK